MTEPRPPEVEDQDGPSEQASAADAETFADLDRRPVTEHVAIFETEHARLRDELSTIDQL